jgi:hypothetical protein
MYVDKSTREVKKMTVESWDPSGSGVLTPPRLAHLLEAARSLEQPDFGLDAEQARALAPVVRQARRAKPGVDWSAAAESLGDDDVVALIRLFTLAEPRLPGWESGDASPVVPLTALLKRRGTYPADLTAWIKANTDNRFLPHGNLMDRL